MIAFAGLSRMSITLDDRALARADPLQVANCAAKRKYGTKESAESIAAGLGKSPHLHPKRLRAMRAYRCPVCDYWHLTKKVDKW